MSSATALQPGSVWIDGRGAQSVAHGGRGIPRMSSELVPAIVEAAPGVVGSIGLDPKLPVPPAFERYEGTGLLTEYSDRPPADRPLPEVFHVLSPFEADMSLDEIWPVWAREPGCRLVTTLYDLIPVIMREEYLAAWGYQTVAWSARIGLLRQAAQVLTISHQTAVDAAAYLEIPEERLTNVGCGVSGYFSSLVAPGAEAEKILGDELRGLRPGFLLYVGGTDPRKNLEGIVQAYGQIPPELRRDHQLVIASTIPALRRFDLRALARSLGIGRKELVLTGFVTDRLLAALYRTCGLFVYPSLYEGGGLPILEAMSCGAPVAVSGVSAMPEWLGDDEGTFDPADPADIASCLSGLLSSPERLAALRERSARQAALYTWPRSAALTVEGYEAALEATAWESAPAMRRASPA
jgi:glycosyltransferase involved in cell wall biosynthesis